MFSFGSGGLGCCGFSYYGNANDTAFCDYNKVAVSGSYDDDEDTGADTGDDCDDDDGEFIDDDEGDDDEFIDDDEGDDDDFIDDGEDD